jgi:hypothetical protein
MSRPAGFNIRPTPHRRASNTLVASPVTGRNDREEAAQTLVAALTTVWGYREPCYGASVTVRNGRGQTVHYAPTGGGYNRETAAFWWEA